MRFALLLILIGFWTFPTLAEDPGNAELQALIDSMSRLEGPQAPKHCDPEGKKVSQPDCSRLTDDICEKLWDPKHDGVLELQTGKIDVGSKGKSGIKSTVRADVQALLDAEKRLPSDLRSKAEPIMNRFRELLKNEIDSKKWHRDFGNLLSDWGSIIEEVAQDRAKASLPKDEKSASSFERKARLGQKKIEVSDQITRAKYANGPNWKRVEQTYTAAKADILAVIDDLKLPAAIREKMKKKLNSVELSLPLLDPRIIDSGEECATTEVNAFYDPIYNRMTVCAGFFNSYPDAAFYTVLIHELGHSIDPGIFADLAFEESRMAQIARKLSNFEKPPFNCREWDKLQQDLFEMPSRIVEPKHPYRKLIDCFSSRKKELEPFNAEKLRYAAKKQTSSLIARYSDLNAFGYLAKSGTKDEPNDFYMRPDRRVARSHNYIPPSWKKSDDIVTESFVQSLSCAKAKDGASFERASREDRNKMFQDAILSAQSAQEALLVEKFRHCGRECRELLKEELSRDRNENFADWISIQAFPRYLSRETSLEKRRELAGLASSLFCTEPGYIKTSNADHDFDVIEKTFSQLPHPEYRVRRLSVFSPKVAELVNCRMDDELKKGFGSCDF